MTAAIEILDPQVVGKIAAGEVVERPASAVKELVENSLDAGATFIHVEIVGGGCDLMRVADNGCGISRDELVLAVQRYATSKIRSAEELSSIVTLGFRGEALASIAAVSHFTVVSRTPGSTSAHQLTVTGGVSEPVVAASRAPGTTITAEGLFFNVPARRKFLRAPTSEAAQVVQVLSQLALVYPEVAFDLTIDGRRSIATPGTGNTLDAALAVLGREVAEALLPVETTVLADRSSGALAGRIGGYAADPRVSRSTRSSVSLFVNRRPVKNRALSYAVEEAYETLLQVGRHPIAVLTLEVPPSEVDVNVHPTKTEVRLLRERLLYGAVREAVREVVSRGETWGKEVGGLALGERQALPSSTLEIPYRLLEPPIASNPLAAEQLSSGGRRLPILRVMGQVAQTYIVAEGELGLYLIDQHAAHERVLHDRLMASVGKEGNTQLMLEPLSLELDPARWELYSSAKDELHALGFRLEPFGERSVLVRGIPSELPHGEAVRVLEETLKDLAAEKPEADWRERIAVALSCRGAVKAGQVLAAAEMRSLIEALEETDITQHCSHGRPTAVLLSHRQLEREFGRR